MTAILVTVGMGVGLLFAGFLGGYVVGEQTHSPKNMMANDPDSTTQWMSTMMDTMMSDPALQKQMMNQMMNDPKMQDMMGMSGNEDSKIIHMGMNNFMPNELGVKPNTTITWQTHDMEIHNVVGIFKTDSGNEITILSGDIKHMEKWSYTFEESGVFEYVCGYHESEGMKGRLVVA